MITLDYDEQAMALSKADVDWLFSRMSQELLSQILNKSITTLEALAEQIEIEFDFYDLKY